MTTDDLIKTAWAMADLMPDVTAAKAYDWLRTLEDAPDGIDELCAKYRSEH